MAETRHKKDDDEKNSINGINITLQQNMFRTKEENENDYIDKVLENAKDNIEKAKQENEKCNNKTETESKNESRNKKLEKLIDDYVDKPVEETTTGERQLLRFEKYFIGLLVILPLIQLILLAVAPGTIWAVYTVISFVLIVFMSKGLKQYSMLFTDILLIAIAVFYIGTGFSHGLQWKDFNTKTIIKIGYINGNTQKKIEYKGLTNEELKKKVTGKFIYYYKYGCKDCLAVETEIMSILNSKNIDVVPIETRTETGQQLLSMYKVGEVPAGLVINKDGTYEARVLYTKDEKGKDNLDKKQLSVLLDELEKN